ncbi:MAG: hypothetical protein ACOC1O_01445 [bacterium]
MKKSRKSSTHIVEETFDNYISDPKVFEEIYGTDTYNDNDKEEFDDEDIDIDDIEDGIEKIDTDDGIDEFEDEFEDELKKALKNEIKVPEFNRRVLIFTDKKTGEEKEGTPMAQIDENTFLFKINGKYKKYDLSDIEVQ